ncbi:MAG: hypothetical protein IIW48_00355, partial [Clostridia bacterium]|nr:hypothetical protein [Clostridia bacterium]
AILACVFVFALAFTTFAAVSPEAPTIDETTTKDPSDIDPTIDETTTDKGETDETTDKGESDETTDKGESDKTTDKGESDKTTDKGESDKTTDVGDVDETTTAKGDADDTTKGDVTSDKGPVSPDTGSHISKTVGAAALVALTLGGAVVYTTKKKAE